MAEKKSYADIAASIAQNAANAKQVEKDKKTAEDTMKDAAKKLKLDTDAAIKSMVTGMRPHLEALCDAVRKAGLSAEVCLPGPNENAVLCNGKPYTWCIYLKYDTGGAHENLVRIGLVAGTGSRELGLVDGAFTAEDITILTSCAWRSGGVTLRNGRGVSGPAVHIDNSNIFIPPTKMPSDEWYGATIEAMASKVA